MKKIMWQVLAIGLVWAMCAGSRPAAGMQKVVMLDFPADELRLMQAEEATKALANAGFVDGQNIEIHRVRPQEVADEVKEILALEPAVVLGFSPRLQKTMELMADQPVPFITSYSVDKYVDADGVPKKMITGIYPKLKDVVYNSFKFLNKVASLPPGKQAVFFWNETAELITKEEVQDALQRLNIPLNAIVNATVMEDWQEGILKYNDDPDVGWFLQATSPVIKRDGTPTDMMKDSHVWMREHIKKPAVAYWESLVRGGGAVCAFGIDMPDRARQVGEIGARVLKGEDIKTITIALS